MLCIGLLAQHMVAQPRLVGEIKEGPWRRRTLSVVLRKQITKRWSGYKRGVEEPQQSAIWCDTRVKCIKNMQGMVGREIETSIGPNHGKWCVHVKELEVYLTEVEETLQGFNLGKHMLRFAFLMSLFHASMLLDLWRVKLDKGREVGWPCSQFCTPMTFCDQLGRTPGSFTNCFVFWRWRILPMSQFHI